MALTPEGAKLLALAEAALQSLAAVDRAAGRSPVDEGELRVGAGDALGREILPRALAALRRERPALAVRLLEGPTPTLIDALRSGDVDVALVTGEAAAEPTRGVELTALLSSPIDLLLGRGTAAPRPAGLAGMAGLPIVSLQRGSGFRRHLETAFSQAGVPFQPAIEVGNLSLVRRFVAAGLGVAPVPAIAFRRGERMPGVDRRTIRGIQPIHYAAALRSGVPPVAAVVRLLELIK